MPTINNLCNPTYGGTVVNGSTYDQRALVSAAEYRFPAWAVNEWTLELENIAECICIRACTHLGKLGNLCSTGRVARSASFMLMPTNSGITKSGEPSGTSEVVRTPTWRILAKLNQLKNLMCLRILLERSAGCYLLCRLRKTPIDHQWNSLETPSKFVNHWRNPFGNAPTYRGEKNVWLDVL